MIHINNTLLVIVAGGAVCILTYAVIKFYRDHTNTSSGKRSGYVYLGSPYTPTLAGSRHELNEECLQHPGYRMCMMTDGTSGVCGTSGMCVPDMLMNVPRDQGFGANIDDIKMPLCVEPIFKEGCRRACECKHLKGEVMDHEVEGCVKGCESMFYPA